MIHADKRMNAIYFGSYPADSIRIHINLEIRIWTLAFSPAAIDYVLFTDISKWYKRVEYNGWRIVSDQLISRLTKYGEPLILESASKKYDFHPSKVWFWN